MSGESEESNDAPRAFPEPRNTRRALWTQLVLVTLALVALAVRHVLPVGFTPLPWQVYAAPLAALVTAGVALQLVGRGGRYDVPVVALLLLLVPVTGAVAGAFHTPTLEFGWFAYAPADTAWSSWGVPPMVLIRLSGWAMTASSVLTALAMLTALVTAVRVGVPAARRRGPPRR